MEGDLGGGGDLDFLEGDLEVEEEEETLLDLVKLLEMERGERVRGTEAFRFPLEEDFEGDLETGVRDTGGIGEGVGEEGREGEEVLGSGEEEEKGVGEGGDLGLEEVKERLPGRFC